MPGICGGYCFTGTLGFRFSIAGDESLMAGLVSFSIIALAALALLALAAPIIRRYPPIGIGLIFLVLITVWDIPNPPPVISLSGLTAYPADVIAVVLLVVAILEVSQLRENLRGWLVPWVFFGVLIAVSLLRGVADFGLATAVNSARTDLHFFCVMTWVFAVGPDRLKLRAASLVLGWVLVLVAAYHGVTHGFGGVMSATAIAGADFLQTGRVLYAGQAAALLLCAGTVLLSPSDSARVRPQFAAVSSAVFLGVVVIAQHRSVWSAGALGMILVLIWSGRRLARTRVLTSLIIGAWLGLFLWSTGIIGHSDSGLFESAFDTRTYDWRTGSWQALISEAIAKGPEVVVGGEPFGTRYLRQVGSDRWTDLSAHNWYVTTFLGLGILGLIMLAGMLIAALVKSRSNSAATTFVIAAVAAYGWAYSLDWYLTPWLGAAMVASLGGLGRADHAVSDTSNNGPINAVSVAGGGGINTVKSRTSMVAIRPREGVGL